MAISWTKIIPRWAGDTIEPPEAKKDEGWIEGDKPPAKWWNWFQKGTYEALDETRDVIEGIDSQLAQTATDLAGKASTTALNSHTGSATAHGITGAVVGTTDTQNLSNKTFTNDIKMSGSGAALKRDNDSNRLLIAGGSDLSNTYGAYMVLEGVNWGGVGQGNNIVLAPGGNAKIIISFGGLQVSLMGGNGSPEGIRTAQVGSLYMRTDGGASTTLYVKQSGSGNTGWIAK